MTADPRHALTAELARIATRAKKRAAERDRDDKRRSQIEAALHKLDIAATLNIPNGVIRRYRSPAGDKAACLNDAKGTLLAVRRTRCSVDFGPHGEWQVPIENLLPVAKADLQGEVIFLGGRQ